MGSAMFDVDEILGSKGNVKAKRCKGGGVIYCKVLKHEGMGDFNLQLRGIKLKNVEGLFRKSDPFFEVLRSTNSGWDTVFRSPPVMDNLNPTWPEAHMDVAILCGGNTNKNIKIVIYDFEKKGDHEFMGEFETTVGGLIAARSFAQGADVNDVNLASAFNITKKGKESGNVVVLRADISGMEEKKKKQKKQREVPPPVAEPVVAPYAPPASFDPPAAQPYAPTAPPPYATPAAAAPAYVPAPPKPTFIDYVSGGCEINLGVAIDFSASNGDPRQPGTPHFLKGNEKNDYETAIATVGKVLSAYDTDHQHSVWGFGAKYGGVIRHVFQCGPAPEVNGVDGILEAYRSTFRTGLGMSEPTDIEDVVRAAAAKAVQGQSIAQARGGQSYSILLILTDGKITDVNKAANAIRTVCDSPLSIVIIGIGDADFRGMNYLDDMQADRDIVQFVPFNQYRHDKHALSAATLSEIPDQLVGYFLKHGIHPNPPEQQSMDDIAIDNHDENEEFTFY
uniref:C2 domain-containing protein n=1 Tax=Ditylum brightwellii TaxID=49249 RepID=A0A7S4RD51_9STRA|mmetsp:Transcript_62322/g.92549  ORF Transcript_62322/g.92549 Transcript_62322/m.92549 type:complete len:506 (+) Transcript_62322:758-2275(+)